MKREQPIIPWVPSRQRKITCVECQPAPDTTNNLLAIAFGMLIVMLVVGGSLWMTHLNSQRMPMYQIVEMQRWRLATSQC